MPTQSMNSAAVVPSYSPNPKHRNGSRGQSQWTIGLGDEQASFSISWFSGCCSSEAGWGLHLVNGAPDYLGVVEDHKTQSFIAKFVVDSSHGSWHGYPADHRNKQQDVPTESVRLHWLSTRILPAPKIRKIGKQQPVKL